MIASRYRQWTCASQVRANSDASISPVTVVTNFVNIANIEMGANLYISIRLLLPLKDDFL